MEFIEMANLYVGDKEKLQNALDSTSVGISDIAKAGKMTTNTAKKAFNGGSLQRSKANGVINALNEHGASPLLNFDDVFVLIMT